MAGGNAIGSGVVVLSANADGLASGLAKGSHDVDQWGKSVGGNLKASLASAGGGGSGGMLSGLLSGASMLGPWGMAGAAVGGALVKGFDAATERLGTLGKINKRADVLGVSASDLQGMDKLMAKVGIEADHANAVFAKMGKNILESGSAAKAMASMGIAPKDIKDKSLTEQFKILADGITKLPKGAEQAAAAMNVFGKAGANLLPMLQRGGSGINEFIEQQKKMGGVLSNSQLKAAGDAAKAWKVAKDLIATAWDGLMNRLAVIAAPIMKFVGNAISGALKMAEPVFDWLGRAIGSVAEVVEFTFDAISDGVQMVVDGVKEWIAGFGDIGAKVPSVREVVIGVFRAIGTAGGYAWDVIAKGMGNVAIGIGKIVEGFGVMIGKFNDVAKSMGLPTILTGTERIGKSIGEWGEKMAGRRFGQAADDFNNWLDKKLKKLAEKPAIAGGIKGLGGEEWQPAKLSGAIERGSKEAYSVEMRARYGDFGAAENVHKKNGKKLDKNNDIMKQLLDKLSGIEAKIEEVGSF